LKRAEINDSNKSEFLRPSSDDQETDGSSCARAGATTIKRNVQIRTSVVVNQDGPLERATHVSAGEEGEDVQVEELSGIEERLVNLEEVFKVIPGAPIPQEVYRRIKSLEDKVVMMEMETSRLVSSGAIPPSAQPFIVSLHS